MHSPEIITPPEVADLVLDEHQQVVHDALVDAYLKAYVGNGSPADLCIVAQGRGGTGKSTTIAKALWTIGQKLQTRYDRLVAEKKQAAAEHAAKAAHRAQSAPVYAETAEQAAAPKFAQDDAEFTEFMRNVRARAERTARKKPTAADRAEADLAATNAGFAGGFEDDLEIA
jgi:hypothetical protein